MMASEMVDVAIIGAGAAGLFAAIWAGRTQPKRRIVALDGAQKLGAKLLVAGGGRCNVTHDQVDVNVYAGASPNAIRKVLRRFDVPQTVAFFQALGVELKREETGKLFPTTDSARTILDALLKAAQAVRVNIQHPCRVETITKTGDNFHIQGHWGQLTAHKVILATGGKSLPKSGSDGQGYKLAKALGHTITERVFPALVPLTLPKDHFICTLSGLTLPTTLEVRLSNGKKVISFTDSTLCTHFGLSGPAVLDISRYFIDARLSDPQTALLINWWPGQTGEALDQALLALGRATPLKLLRDGLPERLARVLCEQRGSKPAHRVINWPREQRESVGAPGDRLPLADHRQPRLECGRSHRGRGFRSVNSILIQWNRGFVRVCIFAVKFVMWMDASAATIFNGRGPAAM